MKEINLHNPAFGKDKKDRESSVKNIVSELTIIKEQVRLNKNKFQTNCWGKSFNYSLDAS